MAGLEFNDVESEFVGPFHASANDIIIRAAELMEQIVGDWLDLQSGPVDDHIFQFRPEPGEERVLEFHGYRGSPSRLCSRRFKKTSMIRS